MDIDKELKRIEQQKKELQKQRQQLLEQKRKRIAALSKLNTLVKQSGFDTPKALVEALIEVYGIELGQGRSAVSVKRRKHTKMTVGLRDQIRVMLKDRSMNQVSKELQISYAVIAKVSNGAYDKL
jgi:FKBP-type peptidyl-prolyl cis-trans isomerase (trigger factor)